MTIQMDRKRENCNHCNYKKDISRYFNLDDYCSLSMKRTSKINMDDDCPLGELEEKNMNKVPECRECKFAKRYDYGKEIYYCDNEDRTDDMGKLGEKYLHKTSPEWCPLRKIRKGDIICNSKI